MPSVVGVPAGGASSTVYLVHRGNSRHGWEKGNRMCVIEGSYSVQESVRDMHRSEEGEEGAGVSTGRCSDSWRCHSAHVLDTVDTRDMVERHWRWDKMCVLRGPYEETKVRIAQYRCDSDQASSTSWHNTDILPRVLTLHSLAIIIIVEVCDRGS